MWRWFPAGIHILDNNSRVYINTFELLHVITEYLVSFSNNVCLSLFHINRATVLTYDLAGAACRRQIADNFSNIQTGPIMS